MPHTKKGGKWSVEDFAGVVAAACYTPTSVHTLCTMFCLGETVELSRAVFQKGRRFEPTSVGFIQQMKNPRKTVRFLGLLFKGGDDLVWVSMLDVSGSSLSEKEVEELNAPRTYRQGTPRVSRRKAESVH